jgi:hypothetical protein
VHPEARAEKISGSCSAAIRSRCRTYSRVSAAPSDPRLQRTLMRWRSWRSSFESSLSSSSGCPKSRIWISFEVEVSRFESSRISSSVSGADSRLVDDRSTRRSRSAQRTAELARDPRACVPP